ncbi:MAG: efflux RND transporter periplasmic adaptor subunit [Acidobacteriota bacterium]
MITACGRAPEPAAPQTAHAEANAEPPRERGTVTIDEKMAKAGWISVEEVRERGTAELVRTTGRLTTHEDSTWKVGSIADGRIVRILVKLGDRVKAGQVLARLHSHDVHEARAEYAKAKSELERSKAALAISERARDRAKKLLDLKAGSLDQLERAEAELLGTQAAVRTAEVDVRRTETHLVENLQIDPNEPDDHTPGDNMHDEDLVPVKSPGAGVVLRRLVTEGSVVTAGQELIEVSDLNRLRLIASVGDQYLPSIRIGATARVEIPALAGRVFQGRVDRIGEEMDPQTRAAEVWITIAASGQALKPEGYANVEIATGGSRQGIQIPSEAVQDIQGTSSVFVEEGARKYALRAVSLGDKTGARVEVTQGLRPRDRVVVKGSFLLKSQLLKSSLESE